MDDEDAITQLRDLLTALERGGNTTQTRITALQNLYTFLEQQEEESDLLNDVHDEIVNGLRAQLKVANPLVTAKVLSVLPIVTDRLTIRQDGHCLHRVRYVMQSLLPPLLACLGDTRDRSREASKAIIVQIAKAASAVTPLAATAANHSSIKSSHETPFALFERIVIESGLTSKVPRVKEQITLLLPVLRQSIEKFPLRPFLPSLVDHLSDADANVREASRATVISLFSNASPTAKSELKKEMEKKGTRKQTVDAIIEQVFSASITPADPVDEPEHAIRKPPTTTSSNRFSTLNAALAAEEVGSGPSSRSASRSASRMGGAGDAKENDIRPVYIASSHELERAFATMVPHFEGKETEHNWQNREQDVVKIRGMLKTSTYQAHPSAFASGIRLLSEGILKAVASLRTTLSIHGITLISELAQQMGDDLEAQAEVFFTALIRMAGFTKKIVANASQATVGEILKSVSYRHKYLELISQGMQDKNFGMRAAMCQHLDTILSVHGKHRKHALEGHAGLSAITTICKKGLADPNKDVRAFARNAFYRVEQIWPSTARVIYDSLDMSIQKQVESNRLPAGQTVPQTPAPTRTAAPAMSSIASPRTPSNKIGPSSALLAAKRAAAASLAKERKEKAEREAQIQAEREMMMAEDEDEEDLMSSPSIGDLNDEELHSTQPLVIRQKLARSPSPSPAPAPPKSPLRPRTSSESTKQQPASAQASSIPLPSSPVGNRSASRSGIARPTNSAIGARSRTTSTSSISSNRSAGRFGASSNINYGSIAQRFDQQSVPSATSPMAKGTINDSVPHADLPTDDFNRSVRVSTPSSPSRIPTRSPPRVLSHSTLEKEREATVADTSTMSFASSVQSGADTSSGYQIPSSPTNQTKLPRPVSMMMYSTPPSGKTGMTARHSHSLSTDGSPSQSANEWKEGKVAKTRFTQPPPSNGNENGSSPFDTQKERGLAATEKPSSKPPTSTTRTVVPPDATSAVKWFLGKADRLENATFADEEPDYANLSPVKQRPESDGYVAQLYTGSATLRTFKGLVSLSKEFKLPQKGVNIMQGDDDSPSLLGLDADPGANREYQIAIDMWQESLLFERIFVALCKYLRSEDVIAGTTKRDLQTAALVFLHRLVEFQFGLFTALDKERDLLDLLIDLIRRNHSGPSAAGVKSACQAIADRWTDQTDVIIGVTTLRSVLSHCMSLDDDGQEINGSDDTSQSNVAVLTLALRTLARLFGRLPGELIEEQLERCKHVVKKGLKHRQIETRQQAVGVLVAANSKIRDPQSLFGILQPIDKAQQDLLIYYMNRA